jgi:hypothetical protein
MFLAGIQERCPPYSCPITRLGMHKKFHIVRCDPGSQSVIKVTSPSNVLNAYGNYLVLNCHEVLIWSRDKKWVKCTHDLQNDDDFKDFTTYNRHFPDDLHDNLRTIMSKNGHTTRIHNPYPDVIIENAFEIKSVAYAISMVQDETVTAIATYPASQRGTHIVLSREESSARIHERINGPDESDSDSQ